MPGSNVVAALLGAASLVAGQVDAPVRRGSEPFAVGAFRTELAADDPVGHKKTGLVCGPAGTLRWRNVEPVSPRASGAAARAIRDAGVPIMAPNADDWIDVRVPTTGYRLIGDILAMRATVCAPAYGVAKSITHGRRLKGDGRTRVAWRIYRLAAHRVVGQAETCAAFEFDRPGMSGSDVGQIGLIENARLVVAALAGSPGTFALPASLMTDAASCPERVGGHRTPDESAREP